MMMVITGQPIPVTVDPEDTILDLRRRVVAYAGYDDGQYWEVRDAGGHLIDQTTLALLHFTHPDDRLFVNLPAGTGA